MLAKSTITNLNDTSFMSVIVNYINKQLFIHFSEIVREGEIRLFNKHHEEVFHAKIENQDFLNLYMPLENGNYQVRISKGNTEKNKSIIVNNES